MFINDWYAGSFLAVTKSSSSHWRGLKITIFRWKIASLCEMFLFSFAFCVSFLTSRYYINKQCCINTALCVYRWVKRPRGGVYGQRVDGEREKGGSIQQIHWNLKQMNCIRLDANPLEFCEWILNKLWKHSMINKQKIEAGKYVLTSDTSRLEEKVRLFKKIRHN